MSPAGRVKRPSYCIRNRQGGIDARARSYSSRGKAGLSMLRKLTTSISGLLRLDSSQAQGAVEEPEKVRQHLLGHERVGRRGHQVIPGAAPLDLAEEPRRAANRLPRLPSGKD